MAAGAWYYRITLNTVATDAQAEQVARHTDSILVARDRGRTEIAAYVTADGISDAIAAGRAQVTAAMQAAELAGEAIVMEVKTEQERLTELPTLAEAFGPDATDQQDVTG